MLISRVWAMPRKWTFQIKPIMTLVRKYALIGYNWADPFAGKSNFAQYRNDLNPAHNQPFCMEALDFLKSLSGPLNGVLFDPPHENMGLRFKGKVKDRISELVKANGYVISFGWNTVGMGKKRGFLPVELLVVCHGGNRNDTLCLVEKKV
jgi:hypothetical protein